MKNRTMDVLKYQAFPELAAAVRATRDAVITRWQAAVESTFPQANNLSLQQIRNSLPDTLEQMAVVLESDQPRPTKDLMDLACSHGETRYDQDFNLGELLIEYSLLRPILIEEVTQHLGRIISIEEIVALNLGVDVSQRRGVVSYVNQQKAELQSLAEAQSKYLSFLSHDLRGGLNGVLLLLEVLRRDLAGEQRFAESLADMDVMRRSILNTVTTMDRFLHAERFRKGKVQVHPMPVDLKALAMDVANQLSYQAKEKDLTVEVQTGNSPTRIETDRELLSLILQNLIGNAIKYSPAGSVTISIACKDGNGHACRISVADQGPGIAPEKLEQLFQSFTRGETHGQSGSGLGLSIARQAADLIGGKLWAESHPGQGSRFHIDLPDHPPTSAAAR